MSELPRKAVARTARLAALPLGYAGRTALGLGKRMGGASAETVLIDVQQRTAEQLFRTLGELKGGAMKFGQAMSIFEAALPDELAAPYREQLTKLQDSAPPMPTMTVREILARELGADWKRLPGRVRRRPGRGSLDRPGAPRPLGRRPRGRGQGPVPRRGRGAREPTCGRSPGWPEALGPLVPGHRRQAAGRGAAGPRRRGARLPARGGGPADLRRGVRATTPTSWSRTWWPRQATVLVTEWMESPDSLAHVIREGHPGGARPLRLALRSGSCSAAPPAPGCCTPTRTRATSGCSPRGRQPGRLGVLDFGAVARLPERQLPDNASARSSGSRRWTTTRSWSPRSATRASSSERIRIDADQLRAYLGPFIEPASVEKFRFSRAWMREQFRRVNDPRGDAYAAMLG